MEFPFGFFHFTITGVTPEEALSVSIHLHDGKAPDTYYKYGGTPDNPSAHWYEFMYDGNTGAEINGNEVVLHFINGIRGDDDLKADDTSIEDVGGPGTTIAKPLSDNPSTASTQSGGGGGGCLIGTAAGSLSL